MLFISLGKKKDFVPIAVLSSKNTLDLTPGAVFFLPDQTLDFIPRHADAPKDPASRSCLCHLLFQSFVACFLQWSA